MKTLIKSLVGGAIMLLAAGSASAHGKVRGYVEVRPYYPAVVQVQSHYAPIPVYNEDRYVSAREARHARREWRRELWRRDHWRHDHRGHDRCRHRHGRHY